MVLVIGATSFIGPAIVKRLLEEDMNIRCLVKTDSNIEKLKKAAADAEMMPGAGTGSRIQFVTGNLQSPDSILYSLKGADSVVCLLDLKNTYLIKNLIEAISKTVIKRVVFIGSTTVMVPLKNDIKDAKVESENMIRRSKLDWTILRASMIYGTEDDRNYSRMLNFIKKHGFFILFGNGNNLIQPIYIDDVAEAVSLALNNQKTFKKIYEICGAEPIKYRDMLNIVKHKMKKPFRIIRLPLKLSKATVFIYSKIFPLSSLKPDMIERMELDKAYSYDEASEDFGFLPAGFEKGIEKLLDKLEL